MTRPANELKRGLKSGLNREGRRRSKLGHSLQKIFSENRDRVEPSAHLFDQAFDEALESWQQLFHFLVSHKTAEQIPLSEALLREHLLAQLAHLKRVAVSASLTHQQAEQCRYLMAVVVDEAINQSRWAITVNWHFNSLALCEFQDSQGGVRFFEMVDRALEQAAANALMLKLCYLALINGFEGRYAREEDAVKKEALALYRQRLRDALALTRLQGEAEHCVGGPRRPDKETTLASIWQKRRVPLTITALMISLIGLYLLTTFSANRQTDRLLSDFESLSHQIAQIPKPISRFTDPDRVKRLKVRLEQVLDEAIKQKRVLMSANDVDVSVTLQGRSLFKSGTDQLDQRYQALLDAIGRELQVEQGSVLITGHTDNVPIFTPKYPSNWHLSKARAERIERSMRHWWHPRLAVDVQGLGDTRPLVPNSSAKNRAKTRRVEIVITPSLTPAIAHRKSEFHDD